MAYMPLFFKSSPARPALIIGGGEIACAKAEALLSCGAYIEIAASEFSCALLQLAEKHGFKLHRRSYGADLLDGKSIVVAATNDDSVNAQIAADANARAIPVNVVDNPALCDFIFPALVRRGPLQIAISSSGISPVLARLVKQTIERAIPEKFEALIDFLGRHKDKIRARLTLVQPRRLFLEELINGAIAEEVLEGNERRAEILLDEALAGYPDQKTPALYLIGAGPGHGELITLKGIRLLSRADVVLYDRLIPPGIIEQYARKDAAKIAVGKTRCHHHQKQEDIGTMLERYLGQGKIVARLKGGDPGIFGHGAEEIEIARGAGAPYQIVPGISAVTGCAAYSGFPLTERGGARGLHLLTLYSKDVEDESFWNKLAALKGDTLAFYMSTPHTPLLCENLIARGFDADMPMVLIEQGTTPFHHEYAATLGSFARLYGAREFLSPCLLVIGDVTRWQERHNWREQPAGEGAAAEYFPPLPGDLRGPALKLEAANG